MGKGKDEEETEDETKPRKSSSSRSADISAVLRGSAEADARARAFFEGRQGTAATMDPRAPKEDKMVKFLKDIEKNTRQQTQFETAEIV